MALFNYDVLVPRIKKLVSEAGHDQFYEIIAPDLIQNSKEQTESDGLKRAYTQLEGAMGSVLLNLDRYYRQRYGEPLVYFVNVGRESRTDFFFPLSRHSIFLCSSTRIISGSILSA